MTQELINLLSTFGFPVIRQGSLAPDAPYPETFFTFWNNDDVEVSAYDNGTVLAGIYFDVNVYARSAETAYTTLKSARDLLKQNGWTIVSRAYDVASDTITHVGRGMEVVFLKTEMEE